MICAQLERLQLAVISSENANNKLSYHRVVRGAPLTIYYHQLSALLSRAFPSLCNNSLVPVEILRRASASD